jgi:hypothetical protein
MASLDEKNHLPDLAPNSSHTSSSTPTQSIDLIPDQDTKLEHSPTPSRPSDDSTTTTPSALGFEPIRTAPATASRTPRRLSADTIDTLRRERSNNGWGCDDIEEDAAGSGGAVAPYNHPGSSEERDPFEVGWDGGDADPMCPRSMPTWRKWVIIGIASTGSFCV